MSAPAADVVVTMGCVDSCPFYPDKRYVDWKIEDPAAKKPATAREIRDEIDLLVRKLLTELTTASEEC